MTIGVADVMKYFNQGKMQWWGWEDTSAGEVYSNLKLDYYNYAIHLAQKQIKKAK